MIPQGSIWQELRDLCLDAIPLKCAVDFRAPMPLAEWSSRGFFQVQSGSRKGYRLFAATADVGAALLTDAEFLLDHAAEHQVSLWREINTTEWLSPAWVAVTFYYWSYFLVNALTRLLGSAAMFLVPRQVAGLDLLAAVANGSPGAGCFRLEVGRTVSLTEREVILLKKKPRVHEETWRLWDGVCRSSLIPRRLGSANSLEDRLFNAIVETSNRLGPEWPSTFRNA